jgi:hypothetical protein
MGQSVMAHRTTTGQLIWGIALILAGVGVFIRIPQVMPRIAQIESFANIAFFIRFCFYFMGLILIGGGLKKVYGHFRAPNPSESLTEIDDNHKHDG